jgi:hypothetical protein
MRRYLSNSIKKILAVSSIVFLVSAENIKAQETTAGPSWIRPENIKSPAVWGIHNGIVISLWPAALENNKLGADGGPRGLLRIGYEYMGIIYHINYLAVEPVVNGKIEFSEISPSQVDGKWGKLIWAGDSARQGYFYPSALTKGIISHPVDGSPGTEELSLYIFIEKFLNGAHPYLKLSIRSDRPEELGIEIFSREDGTRMERCAVTATMGNYSRLRRLYLKDNVVDSRQLFSGYNGIGFIEKESYGASQLLRTAKGDIIAVAETNETFAELASWPQEPAYLARWSWRYRPFYKLVQYWRKEQSRFDPSLSIRVNGRAKYWSGGSADSASYIDIPGGPAFENFELREKYYPGQKMYFGISRKTVREIISGL